MYHQSIYWDYPITLNIPKNNILFLRVLKYASTPRHCEHRQVRGNPFLFFKGEADSFVLRTQNDTQFSYCEYIWCAAISPHPLVIAKPCNGCGNPFSFKRGITDSFALITLAVPKSCYSLGARTTFDRGARRCSLYPAPQALATSLRMTRGRRRNYRKKLNIRFIYRPKSALKG